MERIKIMLAEYLNGFYFPELRFIDLVEILIIAIFFYRVMLWVRDTKAWMLLRGILVIVTFMIFAMIFNMQTILYLAKNSMSVLAMTAIVVFQPEIRRALENLGQKSILATLNPFDKKRELENFNQEIIEHFVEACGIMSATKTGALIVIEDQVKLSEYAATGIYMDCKVSTQILCNIFEHNTPLHDGAIIVREDRILAATCYLPLTEKMSLNKNLGTRHRAAIGISEISDALVIVVSEETGRISVSYDGEIFTKLSTEELRQHLSRLDKEEVDNTGINILEKLRGGDKDETNNPS